jgi:hypothetical protein
MSAKTVVTCLAIVVLGVARDAQAGVAGKALQEALELASKKFGKEVAETGAEKLAARATQLAAKHGDDVVAAAIKKVGPRAGQAALDAGEHGGLALHLLAHHGDEALPLVAKASSLKTVARYGDNAATALIRHGSIGEQFVEQFAAEGAEALAKVTPRNGRRLAMLAAEGQLKPDLINVVSKIGDRACDFIWKNKGALAVGAALTAFVANPEPFIDGSQELTATFVDAALKPIAEVPKAVAAEAARNVNWTLLAIVGAPVMILAACIGLAAVIAIPRKAARLWCISRLFVVRTLNRLRRERRRARATRSSRQ